MSGQMSVCFGKGIGSIISVLLVGTLTASCGSGSGLEMPSPVQGTSDPEDSRFVIGNNGPEGDSGLMANDVRYPLNAALGDIWGVSDDHFQIDFTLTNGNFRVESVTIDDTDYQLLVPAQATAVFHASIFSPGSSFDYADYAHVPSSTVTTGLSGIGFFKDAYVGLDTNHDGMVGEGERHDIIEGTVEFAGTLPDIELRFHVTLIDGQAVSGEYTGLFDFTPR